MKASAVCQGPHYPQNISATPCGCTPSSMTDTQQSELSHMEVAFLTGGRPLSRGNDVPESRVTVPTAVWPSQCLVFLTRRELVSQWGVPANLAA